ncbi:MAG: Uma2 family endonuclease, partial [Acidobacteriota bacterium]
KEGQENSEKLRRYERMAVPYYVIFDPIKQIQPQVLTIYELHVGTYQVRVEAQLPTLHLGLTLWQGSFEHKHDTWLRWCDEHGQLILTGQERAQHERELTEQERQRAEQEHLRAEQAELRAEQERLKTEQERQRVERLAAKLRELGIDPDQL